jgi:hypothetical protein
MRQAVTFRLNSELLEEARRCAVEENRTLTNFMETLLKRYLMARHAPAAREQPPRNDEARPDA